MKIEPLLTTQAVLDELGRRLERTRLEQNLTQVDLAAQAGIGLATIQRIERGEPSSLTNLVRILRALGLIEALDRLVPEETLSPVDLLRLRGKQRRRASSRAISARSERPARWTWGDETGATR